MEKNDCGVINPGDIMAEFYDNLLNVCKKYFSDNGKDFLDRQIKSHLNKSPETITTVDKDELAKWCRISGSLLLGKERSEQLSSEIVSI